MEKFSHRAPLLNERGSIISATDSSGALVGINRYDEYGVPASTNIGRFQYTGQAWLSEAGAYDYKARDYLPHLGIFAQTDPIGYEDSPNLYAYVLNDPVNLTDPLGLESIIICGNCGWQNAPYETRPWPGPSGPSNLGSVANEDRERPILVVARRILHRVINRTALTLDSVKLGQTVGAIQVCR